MHFLQAPRWCCHPCYLQWQGGMIPPEKRPSQRARHRWLEPEGGVNMSMKELGSRRISPEKTGHDGCLTPLWYLICPQVQLRLRPSLATSSHIPCAITESLSLKTLLPLLVPAASCYQPLLLPMSLTTPRVSPPFLDCSGCSGLLSDAPA